MAQLFYAFSFQFFLTHVIARILFCHSGKNKMKWYAYKINRRNVVLNYVDFECEWILLRSYWWVFRNGISPFHCLHWISALTAHVVHPMKWKENDYNNILSSVYFDSYQFWTWFVFQIFSQQMIHQNSTKCIAHHVDCGSESIPAKRWMFSRYQSNEAWIKWIRMNLQ